MASKYILCYLDKLVHNRPIIRLNKIAWARESASGEGGQLKGKSLRTGKKVAEAVVIKKEVDFRWEIKRA